MAYRFDGVDDVVTFSNAPVNGYAAGPVTVATMLKRNTVGTLQRVGGVDASSSARRLGFGFNASTNVVEMAIGTGTRAGSTAVSSTSVWYIVACTWAGGTATPRLHIWNGTAWVHENATSAPAGSLGSWLGSDPFAVGKLATVYASMDVVCSAVDKADHTDGDIETLSPTLFSAWLAFGFDWLVGFESSGTVSDLGAAGTGDETARTGTTLVSDPAGWTWPAAGTTYYGVTATPVTFGAVVAGTGSTPTPVTYYGAVARPFTFNAVTTGVESSPSLAAPTDLTVIPVSTTQIELDWEPSVGATSYRVERKLSGGAYAEIATTTSSAYTDTGLDPHTYYAYRVRADDGDDLSGYTAGRTDAVTDVLPTEGVSIAYGSSLLEPNPGWTRIDVGSVVAEWSIRRGRQDELEKTGTGTAQIRLNDRTGAYAPGDLDGRQVQLALWNPVTATSHTVFRGFADTYNYDVHPSGRVTYIDIEAVDALDFLAGCEVAPIFNGVAAPPGVTVAKGDVYYAEADIQLRIHDLLDEVEWPDELRTVFTGNVYVKQQVAAAGTSMLALLADACDAEWVGAATLYASKLGKVTFHGRLARFSPDATAASAGTAWKFTRWKAGDGSATGDPSYAQLRGLGFARDRKRIINRAFAYPYRDGTTYKELTTAQMHNQVVEDVASIEQYGLHAWSAESLMTLEHKSNGNNDLVETKKMAQHYVTHYKQPQTRLTQLVFRSLRPEDPRAPATWALMCGVEISDIVQVKAAGFDDTEFYVEGISYDVRAAGPEYHDVTLSLDVSPTSYWVTPP